MLFGLKPKPAGIHHSACVWRVTSIISKILLKEFAKQKAKSFPLCTYTFAFINSEPINICHSLPSRIRIYKMQFYARFIFSETDCKDSSVVTAPTSDIKEADSIVRIRIFLVRLGELLVAQIIS